MTVTTIKSLKKQWIMDWLCFYSNELEKTLDTELSPKEIDFRVDILEFTNDNAVEIISKLDELRMVLPHMAEVANVLHNSLDDDYEYRPLGFIVTINEHIQIRLDPDGDPGAELLIECKVEREDGYLSFVVDEHDHEELKIEMNSN